jgi:hypothetical protein
MKLIDVVKKLARLSDALVIYIDNARGAAPESDVVLFDGGGSGGVPQRKDGMQYFLEVSVANDCVRAWSTHRKGKKPTTKDKCAAIIYYAQNDAYLMPPDAPRHMGPPLQIVEPGRGSRLLGPATVRVGNAPRPRKRK